MPRSQELRKTAEDRLLTGLGNFISRRSDTQLARLERRPAARATLEAIFAVLPHRLVPGAAQGVDATFEFRLRDERSGLLHRYQVTVRDGACSVARNGTAAADVVLSLRTIDFVRLASGASKWHGLYGTGRMKAAGDPFVILRLPALFGLAL
jgi:alkyl sulfatase BDS1-like metallo-beta-lactamase superfamily hydrolase